ncbi:hypothetical protein Agub_g12480, partial [Astrephomene gubernaculifera]
CTRSLTIAPIHLDDRSHLPSENGHCVCLRPFTSYEDRMSKKSRKARRKGEPQSEDARPSKRRRTSDKHEVKTSNKKRRADSTGGLKEAPAKPDGTSLGATTLAERPHDPNSVLSKVVALAIEVVLENAKRAAPVLQRLAALPKANEQAAEAASGGQSMADYLAAAIERDSFISWRPEDTKVLADYLASLSPNSTLRIKPAMEQLGLSHIPDPGRRLQQTLTAKLHLMRSKMARGEDPTQVNTSRTVRGTYDFQSWVRRALLAMPNHEGTMREVAAALEADPNISCKLDKRPNPKCPNTPIWWLNLRCAVMRYPEFIRTDAKRAGHAVYRYEPEKERKGDAKRTERRPEWAEKRRAASGTYDYQSWIRRALLTMPNHEGTMREVAAVLEADPNISSRLDMRPNPSAPTTPIWWRDLRSAAGRYPEFVKTDAKRAGNTVYRYEPEKEVVKTPGQRTRPA